MAKIIHLLDNDTINKIAAGEVIENPKSIVKELVENSIDAGSDEIIIEIKNGGKNLIRITDNGKGIDRGEIEDAFKRHCTSKIQTSDDLNSLFTLGFRGEALASIAAVSQIEVISRTIDEQYGVKLVIKGGEVTLKEDIGCPVGTTISVTELFYNVPARKKFLKSDASESSHINEIVSSLALSKKNISFKYINNNNIAFKTPKTNNFINTISSLYDKDLYDSLLSVNYQSNLISIQGYTSNLNYYRGNRKNQLVFVNGRYIKHKRINYYIEAAYYTLLPKNKYPACFLKLEINPTLVDVNVHPAKTEVRFQNEELILNEVKNAIYKSLRTNNIIKEVKKETIIHNNIEKKNKEESIFEDYIVIDSDTNLKNQSNKFSKNNYSDYTNNYKKSYENHNDNIKYTEINVSDKANLNHIFDDIIEESVLMEEKTDFEIQENNVSTEKIYTTPIAHELYLPKQEQEQQTFIEIHDYEKDDLSKNSIPELSIVGIMMDTYIICESRDTLEMYMIDQHAAHERINYEKFLYQYNNREILKQELIVPEVINLSYDDYYLSIENKEIFEQIGLTIEVFGSNSIIINNIPIIFSNANIKDLFYTVLDSLKNINKSKLNLEIDKIIKKACVKSVKAGDKLHMLEVKRLIDDLKNTHNPYTCPHGRPVIIKMTKYEIERMFERIQN
ncbi:DNA mismatch repair protein MutL [Sedimentibacter acidaminivorans]|uniref:DNA mismatch repair protein MutL n=1 Tax=Sedimentibacter acidaminivorans TaxID=913099 RepID=A0ABS4GCA9_9FIRM|nr:DNA mismatch repair endonuclease MutL [Sedimentibacter acidaminivorans]MBP1925328.1 DNA mismatch repair protein MutL [Sedimentibacter acidaminivorans]